MGVWFCGLVDGGVFLLTFDCLLKALQPVTGLFFRFQNMWYEVLQNEKWLLHKYYSIFLNELYVAFPPDIVQHFDIQLLVKL